jgi:hypothetical protein
VKLYERFLSQYEPSHIPIPETKSIPFDIVNYNEEFLELASLKYMLIAIVLILGTMLFIQIVPLIRDEINLYKDNKPSFSTKTIEANK